MRRWKLLFVLDDVLSIEIFKEKVYFNFWLVYDGFLVLNIIIKVFCGKERGEEEIG